MLYCCKVNRFTPATSIGGGDITAKDLTYSVLLDYYGSLLTERQRDLLTSYYDEDLSLSEISENTGISRQGIRDAIKRGEAELDRLEDSLGIAASQTEIKRETESICGILTEIANASDDDVASRLHEAIERISALAER